MTIKLRPLVSSAPTPTLISHENAFHFFFPTGVSQSVVGQSYECLRIEGNKAMLQAATGKIFKIRADAVSQTPKAPSPNGI